jgi:F-type H+-transporting ATPase subunit alpha
MPYKKKRVGQIGRIVSFFSGIALLDGLPNVFLHEVLLDEHGAPTAMVIGFDNDFVEALFFTEDFNIDKPVFASNTGFSITVSSAYLGRISDGLSNPLDGEGVIKGRKSLVFREAVPVIEREPVIDPLTTGIKIIDTSLPLGRGQRELIIGDRKLGKSTLAADIVLNQNRASTEVYCVYVLCGQKKDKLDELVGLLKKNNAFSYTAIIAASSGTSFAQQYLAPFVGVRIAEYFRDIGKDVLIVYDDLSKHAKAYRDISLLLNRAPGREAYPGDIFYLHAQLLERAGKLSKEKGGGSITALPIIETQEGDITSFIPTNLISITDGQIYLERGLFQKGFLPAVNVGLSVSRVGGRAQPKALKEIVGEMRLVLAQHKQLQKLVQLETEVSSKAREKIRRGDIILELLKQNKHTNFTWQEQAVLFYAAKEGFFDDIDNKMCSHFEKTLLEMIKADYPEVLKEFSNIDFNLVLGEKIKKVIKDFKGEFPV